MSRTPRVWIVDDDPELRSLLDTFLTEQGFEVRTFPDSRDVERRLSRERPDILVLDRMMQGEDGLDLCRRIRANGDDVPIIMLTAKSEAVDRIVGIESGADDYLGKPFVPRELTARIQAVLRRRTPLPAGAPVLDQDCLDFGACRLDFASRTLWRNQEKLSLTSGEFSLLTALARHPHRPLTRERLVELARGPGSATFERSIDVQVSRLRKMVESNPAKPQYIQTVWGYGYVFVPDTPAGVASAGQ
ncbi:MAG TPA: two-component system response regulator OmpR [Rhodocyclaceae bacterium]|nr:two-component system response regulator OmpR [Rhodocyclaceae bacterium]